MSLWESRPAFAPVHTREILCEEFIYPLVIPSYRLVKDTADLGPGQRYIGLPLTLPDHGRTFLPCGALSEPPSHRTSPGGYVPLQRLYEQLRRLARFW